MSTKINLMILLIFVMLGGVGVYVFASENDNHTVAWDDFSFVLNSDIGKNVNIVSYAGDPVEGATPGFTEAAYTQFLFYSDDSSYGFLFDQGGGIRLYQTADLAQYPFMQDVVDTLDALTTEQPELQPYMEVTEDNSNSLPFLPVMLHGQTIKARAQYVETDFVRGIAFITTSQAAAEPFLSNQFFYTFQGLSNDGEYYVSVVIPLNTTLFPEATPADFDMATFVDTLPQYLADSVATLNNAGETDFSPVLITIDELVQSIHFAK